MIADSRKIHAGGPSFTLPRGHCTYSPSATGSVRSTLSTSMARSTRRHSQLLSTKMNFTRFTGWGHRSPRLGSEAPHTPNRSGASIGDDTIKKRSLPFREIVVIALACLAMVGLQARSVWRAHLLQVRETETSLTNLASALSQHAEDTVSLADVVLVGLVERLQTDGTSPAALARIVRMLPMHIASVPGLRDIVVLDSDGRWLAGALAAPPVSFSDREYFRHHRDNPDHGVFVGPSVLNTASGHRVITASRRFESADGSFAGVVVAVILASHFADHYAGFDLGPDSAIGLYSTEGLVLARYPWDERLIGRSFPGARLFSELRDSPGGSYEGNSAVDGVLRYFGYRRSSRYSLVVVASMSKDYALSGWRVDAGVAMTISIGLIGIVGLLGFRLIGQMRRSQTTEAWARESEARSRLLLQSNVTEALCLLDPDGHVESWNTSAERIAGYTAAEVVGRDYALFFTPEDIAAGEPGRVLATARDSGRYTAEAWLIRKDGTPFLARVAIDAIRRDDGGLRGFVTITLDITKQRSEEQQRERLSQELAEARDQARANEERALILLHSNVTEAMYFLDPDGNIETWNASAERIKGYTADEIIGRNFAIFFPPEDVASGEPARVLATAREHGHFTDEAWRVRKDGSRFWARVALDAISPEDGTLRGFVKVTSDITGQQLERQGQDQLSRDLAKARDHAEEASQAKSRFLATITHDLRTPLHGILGYVELLKLEGGLNAKQSERLDAMMAAGQYLLGTINAVLDMSLIEADQIELQPEEIDLPDLVRGCLEVVRPEANAKGLALSMAPTASLRLFADPTRLRQVVVNLLGNAVKFTPAGSVEVRLQQPEARDRVRFEVADTGPGVWARHRDKLFQTFERLNVQAVSGIEGSGLGLAIAARLVQLMGGQIGYEDNPGGGSVFWVELPCGELLLAEAEAAPRSSSAAGSRLRVLVVDDEALNRSIASGFLSVVGHEVVCLDNGAAAVEAAATGDFDVILMDVRMPGMNGLEATRRIRTLPPPRGNVRIVAVTAHAFAQQIETCRQAGMDGHVAKPFNQAELLAALEATSLAPNRGDAGSKPLAAAPPDTASGNPASLELGLNSRCLTELRSRNSARPCPRRIWRRTCGS
jgi:two-component system sensor histidine kinase/response regulator